MSKTVPGSCREQTPCAPRLVAAVRREGEDEKEEEEGEEGGEREEEETLGTED